MFENSIMLAGLGGAVVPVVIHLLGRARYRTIDWGAMMFITSGEPRWRDGAKLREWALLLVRMAAVAMLAIALARPLSGAAGQGTSTSSNLSASGITVASPDSRVAAAIVVDCSGSMAYEDVGGSRMERAASATLQILSTLRRGDRAALIIAGTAGQGGVDNATPPQMTGDLQSLATRASELKPAPGIADLAESISTAATLLDRQDRFARQLYVVCDRQAVSWRYVGPDLFAPARNHFTPSRFIVVPVGGDETDNLSIESIALLNPPAVRGCAAQVSVRVRNHGPAPRTGVPLLLRLAGKDVFTETLNIAGGDARSVVATLRFDTSGTNVLTAELSGAGPNLDDRRSYIVEVSPPLRVLIVRGGDDDATMLKAALAPYASAGREGDDLATTTIVPAIQWDATKLSDYAVVLLHDVPAPTTAQAAALEQYVYAGGGLLIAPGAAAQVDAYNQRLYHDESGLLPAMLGEPISPEAEFTIDPGTLDTTHPLLRFLSEHPGLVATMTGERFMPTQRLTAAAHVLAGYDAGGGGAFLIESAYGRGRVALITSALGASWSNLPLTNLYLPLVQSTVRYLAGANVAERNVAFGQELLANFTPPAPGVHGEVIRPDGSHDECDLTTIAPRTEARYRRTDLPGVYTLRVGPRKGERSAQFTVAPPAAESDLTPLTQADWNRLETALGFKRIDLAQGISSNVATAAGSAHGGGEYWLAALTAVMVLLVVELALTRAWAWEGKHGP
jgi:hypothetical protein